MKADPNEQLRLLDLREVDTVLDRLRREASSSPLQAEVTATKQALVAADEAVVVARTRQADLERQVKRAEQDVENVRSRVARDRQLLDSGSVSSKQMGDIEHELVSLARRQSELEDAELEIMQELEDAAQAVTAAEEVLAEASRRTALAQQDWSGRQESMTSETEALQARRAEARAAIPDELLKIYDRARDRSGEGVGLLRQGRCGACQLQLSSVELAEMRSAADDDVIRCEECGAIIVRDEQSGL